MKILITGGDGFIGEHLIKELSKEHVVTGLSRKRKNSSKWIRADITESDAVERIGDIHTFDVIYHLAATLDETLPYSVMYNINVQGTKNILKLTKLLGATLIFISTAGVLGSTDTPATEDAPYNPKTKYEKTKYEAEKLLLNCYKNEKIPIMIIRPTLVYGENKYWLNILRGVKNGFPLIGNGKNYFQLVYIKNLIQALKQVLSCKKYGSVYNIADGERYTLEEVYTIMGSFFDTKHPHYHIPVWLAKILALYYEAKAKVANCEPFLTRAYVDRLVRNRNYSIDKAIKELGYKPEYNFKEGICEVIKSLRMKKLI